MKLEFIVVAILFSGSMGTEAAVLKRDSGKTEFLAVVKPTGIRINGKGAGPEGHLDLIADETGVTMSGRIEVDLNSLDTGMALRNRHMKDNYLETSKFPAAVLTLNEVKISKEHLRSGGQFTIPAQLNVRGTDQSVLVSMSLRPEADQIRAVSSFKIKITEFGMKQPTFAGLTVTDEVEVTATTSIPKAEVSDL